MKVWYRSKTIWLLIAQLLGTWALHLTGEVTVTATLAINMTTVGGFITRYYTREGISLTNGDK
jgi:hypothetical protein